MDFNTVADDFFVNFDFQTTLALPNSRESVLHFCEAIQKEFPDMTSFYQRETGEFVLEGNHDTGSYQWMEMQTNRLLAGHFNPPDLGAARRFHQWLLERSVYFLGLSGLDVARLDVLFGFNLDFRGNRDAIINDALMGGSPLTALISTGAARCIECEPSVVVALDEDCYLQARLSVETRSDPHQVRTGQYDDEPISIYFAVRRLPQPGRLMDPRESFARQLEICEDYCRRIVVPQVVQPVIAAISAS